MLQEFQTDRPHYAAAAAATGAAALAPTAATTTTTSSSSPVGTPTTTITSTGGGGGGSSGGGGVGGGEGARAVGVVDSVSSGMAAVMACYEKELKSPIRNLVAGDLARTLLIQVGGRGRVGG